MGYQEQWNGYAAFKVQSGLGVPASGSGAKVIRQTGGQGIRMTKASIGSKEIRRDGMSTRGRHGLQKTAGSYSHELSIGGFDDMMEAVMRGTWSAANLQLTQANFTSLTTGANTIVFTSGSPISLGVKVGDVWRLTNQATSTANNNINLRVTGVSSTTVTVAETLVVNVVPDTSCELTRTGRVLVNPGPGNLVKRYFTIEEYEYDTDQSEVSSDAVWGSYKLTMAPNGLLTFDTSLVGTGQFDPLASGASPMFTSPATSTGVPLAVVEAKVRLGGTDLVDLTSFDITVDIKPSSPDVISPSPYAPDVFNGSETVMMNMTMLRKDLLLLADFVDETPLSLHVLAEENESAPKDFFSLFVGNFTLGSVDKSALAKEGGPRTQSVSVPADLVGVDNTGAGYDATQVKIQVSNAT
ncbi:phage tail tube protein [Mesorhizobium sp. M1409]|uniref:phage tail tube protein n=1 Tax=Mesorhizobium sp. M1409 TaxID=2957100 RepID=UPI00333D51F0